MQTNKHNGIGSHCLHSESQFLKIWGNALFPCVLGASRGKCHCVMLYGYLWSLSYYRSDTQMSTQSLEGWEN